MSNQQPEMSRRDWFRLSKPAANNASQPKLGEHQQSGMRPTDEPVNHGGVDLSSLPPMHEAILDTGEVTSLFSDLEAHAADVQLIVARSAAGNTPDQSKNLTSARDQFLSGKVKKMQIRYRWDNVKWIDTLQRSPSGYRLVRIKHG